nr:MAG TPA: hypothetical protein [Crassvirales sp.]
MAYSLYFSSTCKFNKLLRCFNTIYLLHYFLLSIY